MALNLERHRPSLKAVLRSCRTIHVGSLRTCWPGHRHCDGWDIAHHHRIPQFLQKVVHRRISRGNRARSTSLGASAKVRCCGRRWKSLLAREASTRHGTDSCQARAQQLGAPSTRGTTKCFSWSVRTRPLLAVWGHGRCVGSHSIHGRRVPTARNS